MIQLTIDPLSVNKAYTGKRYATKEYKSWKKHISFILPNKLKIPKKIHLIIEWGFKNKLSDVDNPAKTFIDCLQKKYGFNDRDVWKLEMTKIITDKPFIRFSIKSYG